MRFEILVEDASGKKALKILVPKILGDGHEIFIRAYKGIGNIPKNLTTATNVNHIQLLNDLPRILRAYGKTFSALSHQADTAVVVVCDLDNKNLNTFLGELQTILSSCNPQPQTCFCIAIEEGEAWFLGDIPAIKQAFPQAKDGFLTTYINDDICGTWECLANAVYKGGAGQLSSLGHQAIGKEKSFWAEKISPHMNVENNASPSFVYFRDSLRKLSLKSTTT